LKAGIAENNVGEVEFLLVNVDIKSCA